MKIIVNQINKYLLLLLSVVYLSGASSCRKEVEALYASEVTADFTSDMTTILEGQTIAFESQATGDVTSYSWTFTGGIPATSMDQDPQVTYQHEGTYEVTLVVSNAGHTDVMTKKEYIIVTKAPLPVSADFKADKVSVLSGNSISFTDLSTGGPTTWAWQFISPTGQILTSAEKNPVITFQEVGKYTVKLNAANSKYSDEATKTDFIEILDANAVSADFNADVQLTYTGREINFTDSSIGQVTSWQWSFEGGTPATSTQQNPKVVYNTPGRYKVKLTVSNAVKTADKEMDGYITVVPGNGLLTLLSFNGSKDDAGPLGLSVNNTGAVTFTGTDRHGNAGKTAVFDGTGNLAIPVTSNRQFGAGSYTIGFWMKSGDASTMTIWNEGKVVTGLIQAWFRLNDNTTSQIYRFTPNTGKFVNVATTDASPLTDNNWHYVVCVRDMTSSIAKLYVDGTLVKSLAGLTAYDLTNTDGFFIGGQKTNADETVNRFTGQLDDFIIYNRALSDQEIQLLSSF